MEWFLKVCTLHHTLYIEYLSSQVYLLNANIICRLQSKKVDAIDYFQEKLRKLDDDIIAARKKEYKATPIAFVTMDSIQKCQALVQMVIDGEAGQLLAKQAPAPSVSFNCIQQ